jgi:hypothetical protein
VQPGKDWVWHEERIHELLSTWNTGVLFVSGCASNMGRFYPYFKHIVLLTAPDAIIVRRLNSRLDVAYGQSSEEIARVLRLKQSIEPLLRQIADMEIDTSIPGQPVVELILQHIGINNE